MTSLSSSSSQYSGQRWNPKIVVIYAYYEKNERYRINLLYFLKHGYRSPDANGIANASAGVGADAIDYVFVVNGQHTVDFPKVSNLHLIQRENTGFEFKGIIWVSSRCTQKI